MNLGDDLNELDLVTVGSSSLHNYRILAVLIWAMLVIHLLRDDCYSNKLNCGVLVKDFVGPVTPEYSYNDQLLSFVLLPFLW